MATAYSPSTGTTFQLDEASGQWTPIVNPDVPIPGEDIGAVPVSDQGMQFTGKNAFGLQWPGNGPLDMLGAFNPAFAGTLGITQAVKGLGAVAGATRGGAQMFDAAAQAGGMLSRGGEQIGNAYGAARNAWRGANPAGDGYALGMQTARGEPMQAATMAQRVSDAAGLADDVGPRWQEGLMTVDELDAIGVPLSQPRRAALAARASDQAGIDRATAGMLAEDTRGAAGGIVGARNAAVMAQTKGYLDDAVRGASGIPRGVAFNDAVIGSRLAEVGDDIGRIGADAGWIRFDPEDLKAMRNVVDDAGDAIAGPLRRQLDDLEKAANGTGVVDGQAYQHIYSRLNKMTQSGNDPEKIMRATDLLKSMEDSLARNLSPSQIESLKNARYQYRLLKRLKKPGAISPDGSINPRSFRRSWNKGTSDKLQGADPIGKLTETIDFLTQQRAHTGNTLQRFIDEVPGRVQAGAATTALGGLGAAAYSMFGD